MTITVLGEPQGGEKSERVSDIDNVLTKLRALIGDSVDMETLRVVVHDGAPASKARARSSRFSNVHYTPRRTVAAQDGLAWRFKAQGKPPLSGAVAVLAIFYRPNFQRIDVDNLTKLVMDAATQGGVWADDSHVTAQASFVELDVVRPRTVVAICPTRSTLDRSARFTCLAEAGKLPTHQPPDPSAA